MLSGRPCNIVWQHTMDLESRNGLIFSPKNMHTDRGVRTICAATIIAATFNTAALTRATLVVRPHTKMDTEQAPCLFN